jgi:hypothetical protein
MQFEKAHTSYKELPPVEKYLYKASITIKLKNEMLP